MRVRVRVCTCVHVHVSVCVIIIRKSSSQNVQTRIESKENSFMLSNSVSKSEVLGEGSSQLGLQTSQLSTCIM
eukprot:m.163502 g.163502  ORF g.163502 m.163502 type:complete len:73 (-) comp31293_c2_seq4:1359-1577(-)